MNCGTSFYGGFVIFSVIGFMAQEAGLPVKDVVTTGNFLTVFSGFSQIDTVAPFLLVNLLQVEFSVIRS